MCLAQGHNAVTPVRFEPAGLWSRVKHSTTEPLRFSRDIGAIIVQHGYELSIEMLYGHSRVHRSYEKFCWVYVRFPTHPP